MSLLVVVSFVNSSSFAKLKKKTKERQSTIGFFVEIKKEIIWFIYIHFYLRLQSELVNCNGARAIGGQVCGKGDKTQVYDHIKKHMNNYATVDDYITKLINAIISHNASSLKRETTSFFHFLCTTIAKNDSEYKINDNAAHTYGSTILGVGVIDNPGFRYKQHQTRDDYNNLINFINVIINTKPPQEIKDWPPFKKLPGIFKTVWLKQDNPTLLDNTVDITFREIYDILKDEGAVSQGRSSSHYHQYVAVEF